jgi:hypothetical protein
MQSATGMFVRGKLRRPMFSVFGAYSHMLAEIGSIVTDMLFN